jgi:hypothetical protein
VLHAVQRYHLLRVRFHQAMQRRQQVVSQHRQDHVGLRCGQPP